MTKRARKAVEVAGREYLQSAEVAVRVVPLLDGTLRFEPQIEEGDTRMVSFEPILETDPRWNDPIINRSDLFAMRDQFFKLKTLEQALEFAQVYGPLEIERREVRGEGLRARVASFLPPPFLLGPVG